MAISLYSACINGVTPHIISVEVDVSPGLSQFIIVGLADTSIQESKQRVRFALRNSGMHFPRQKKVVNLAPAQLHKRGSGFDLPIALGLLAVSGQISSDHLSQTLVIGELGLDASLNPVRGILPIIHHAKKHGFSQVILPHDNLNEALHIPEIALYSCKDLHDVLEVLRGSGKAVFGSTIVADTQVHGDPFIEIKGQVFAKRALTIAAAGGHHILLSGPPGCGKSLLGNAFHNLLPALSYENALETSTIHSVAGLLQNNGSLIYQPPIQKIHQSISLTALIGGGGHSFPGAISLAHNGVLLIDEIAEFSTRKLNALRQPLEQKTISIHRMKMNTVYPCNFQLVATMNPCPCGFAFDSSGMCSCSQSVIDRYQRKISGPLIDRIDMCVQMQRITHNALLGEKKTAEIDRCLLVKKARDIQIQRQQCLNADLFSKQLGDFCQLENECRDFLSQAIHSLQLTGRSFDSVKKIARTIADLEESSVINAEHFAEALQYRVN